MRRFCTFSSPSPRSFYFPNRSSPGHHGHDPLPQFQRLLQASHQVIRPPQDCQAQRQGKEQNICFPFSNFQPINVPNLVFADCLPGRRAVEKQLSVPSLLPYLTHQLRSRFLESSLRNQ